MVCVGGCTLRRGGAVCLRTKTLRPGAERAHGASGRAHKRLWRDQRAGNNAPAAARELQQGILTFENGRSLSWQLQATRLKCFFRRTSRKIKTCSPKMKIRCDKGRDKNSPVEQERNRAGQNVVFEHGYLKRLSEFS